MSVWRKIKNFFTRGHSGRDGLPLKEKTKVRSKDVRHAVLMFILIFVALVMFSETTLAIINLFFWGNSNFEAFIYPIAIMPTIAIALTIIVIYVNNENSKMAVKFTEAFNKVSHGEFGYSLEVPPKGQFKELFENFNKMSKELLSIQTLKDEFIHDFSHEFKTPIASINGFANLLLEGGLSEDERKQIAKIIADESARLSRLSETVLTLSKLESQQFVGESRDIRLDVQLRDCIVLLQREWEGKGISIDTRLSPVKYTGDENLLRQVWLNLISNAVKFTPAGGKVTVSLTTEGGRARVDVSDTGIGIPEEEQEKIFDKFYQVNKGGGNGLGLAICRRICSICGGKISVKSRPGEGSTFTVIL